MRVDFDKGTRARLLQRYGHLRIGRPETPSVIMRRQKPESLGTAEARLLQQPEGPLRIARADQQIEVGHGPQAGGRVGGSCEDRALQQDQIDALLAN